ncbi:MAG: ABC transporter ATP-binding protein [Marinilabilia sp.]
MANSIIELHNVSYRYASGTLALDSVNLVIPKGKKIALIGGNGAGKSTLMLLLNGIIRPTNGHLSFESVKYGYKKSQLRKLRSKIGLIFSDSDNQLIAPTVYEEISFGLNNISKDEKWVRARVEETLDAFSLNDLSEKPTHELSTGQKKRVCMAAVLAMAPEVIVSDEPASGLDPWYEKNMFGYLDRLHQEGKTIIISTHDVNQAYSWADHVIVLYNGKILLCGTSKDVFSRRDVIEKTGLNLPFIVEASYALKPEIEPSELPSDMKTFYNMLETENKLREAKENM